LLVLLADGIGKLIQLLIQIVGSGTQIRFVPDRETEINKQGEGKNHHGKYKKAPRQANGNRFRDELFIQGFRLLLCGIRHDFY